MYPHTDRKHEGAIIETPESDLRPALSDALNRLRADRVRSFMTQNRGYYRHLTISHPQVVKYEADDEDILFLKKLFPTELKETLTSAQLALHPLVQDFGTLVDFIEERELYKEADPKLSEVRLQRPAAWGLAGENPAHKSAFLSYYRKKAEMLKRKFGRQYWRSADLDKFFGTFPKKFVAFTPRDKKSSRSNTFRKDAELLARFDALKKENEYALALAQLVYCREELKLIKL